MTAARDRPLLFSAPMVRAILDGRKTQTRRVLKPQPPDGALYAGIHYASCEPDSWFFNGPGGRGTKVCVRWRPGDRAWVREAWKAHSTFNGVAPRDIPQSTIFYAADDRYAPSGAPWRSPIHMPRWVSRLTLLIEDVRVQRLQDISEEDAVAEGIDPEEVWKIVGVTGPTNGGSTQAFATIWDRIHGPGAWGANPWVCALSFRAIHANFDALDATTPSGERG